MVDDRRKTYRFPPSDSSEKVALRHNGVDYPVTVVNVSAEGFRLSLDVESEKGPNVTAGDVALLATGNGRHEVRVAHVNRDAGSLQLGVIRLKDFHDPRLRSRREANEEVQFSGRRAGSPLASPFVQALILAAVAALIVVAISVGSKLEQSSSAQEKRTAPHRETARPAWRPAQDPLEMASNIVRRSNSTSPVFGGGRTYEPGMSDRSTSRTGDVVLPHGTGRAAEAAAIKPESSANRNSTNQGAVESSPGTADGNTGSRHASPFDAASDGSTRVAAALKKATRENKHVLVEFGTEKSDASIRLHNLLTTNAEIAVALEDFVLVALDWRANQAMANQFSQDGRPLDSPVLTLLDQDGKVLRFETLKEIEDGRKPDIKKIKAFLRHSSPSP